MINWKSIFSIHTHQKVNMTINRCSKFIKKKKKDRYIESWSKAKLLTLCLIWQLLPKRVTIQKRRLHGDTSALVGSMRGLACYMEEALMGVGTVNDGRWKLSETGQWDLG